MTEMKILRIYSMRIRATNFMSASPRETKLDIAYRFGFSNANFQSRKSLLIL